MARNRIVWSPRPPRRAFSRLTWTVLAGVAATGAARLVFGDEPIRASGGVNPFALIVPLVIGAGALLCVPALLAVVRRPQLSADHYGLTVRAGWVRTLVLPWALVAELALVVVEHEPFLLVRCGARPPAPDDWPRWFDRGHLRTLRRNDAAANAYDLALSLRDFVGRPSHLFAALVHWAPEHVLLATRVSRS